MKEHESTVVIKMHKQHIMEVYVNTCMGKHKVVDIPVHYKQTIAIPIQTVDVGVIILYIGGGS